MKLFQIKHARCYSSLQKVLALWCLALLTCRLTVKRHVQEANETEAMRKKREKLERKQNKVKYSKGRR